MHKKLSIQLKFPLLLCCYLFSLTNAVIPKPSKLIKREKLCSIDFDINFNHSSNKCFILDQAIKRFRKELNDRHMIIDHHKPVNCIITEINIIIREDCDETERKLWPDESMNETYSVIITDRMIEIKAEQIWGVLRALGTISQSVYSTSIYRNVIFQFILLDGPRFPHRGFLIDSSRHFLPSEEIHRFIDAMAMVKMNVLHWHLVDDQSFSYSSYEFPDLASKGAYHSTAAIYTQDEVAEILEYARIRGVRVMAEFDSPAHTLSWGKGYPELLTECNDPSHPEEKFGPINPAQFYTYKFMMRLLGEVMDVFPDNYLHLGGDEVSINCWKSNRVIQNFMKKMQFGDDYSKLENYYIGELIKLVKGLQPPGRRMRPVVWQEIFDNGFRGDKSVVIQVWQSGWERELKTITSQGFNAILSSCWYLNYISYGSDWQKFYDCEPLNFEGTTEQKKLVLGGEAAMWGEYVDESNFFSTSWPRGAAVAERLWSTGSLQSKEFKERMNELICQMKIKGWKPEPIDGPGWCNL